MHELEPEHEVDVTCMQLDDPFPCTQLLMLVILCSTGMCSGLSDSTCIVKYVLTTASM